MSSDLPRVLQLTQHFALSQAIFGAYQAGIWDFFERSGDEALEAEAFAASNQLRLRYVRGLLEYLARRELLEVEPSQSGKTKFRLAEAGKELVHGKWLGYIVFMVGGYGAVLGSSGRLATGEVEYGKDIVRDGRYVALGSELQGEHPNHKSFQVISERLAAGTKPDVLLDIGCGSARFMLRLMKASGTKRGIGVDVDQSACDLAEETVAAAGASDDVRIICGDASRLADLDASLKDSVDAITAMFIIHEFFSRGLDEAARILHGISRVLRPGTGRFLIMDKCTDVLEEGEAPAYFTEFKLVHDLTDQDLITSEKWRDVFREAQLEVTHQEKLAPHTGTILFECRRAS